jgi:MFS family permease
VSHSHAYPLRRHFAYLTAFCMDFTFSAGAVAAVYMAKGQFLATPAQLGLYSVLASSAYIGSTSLFGRLSDRWGRRPNIWVACLLNAAAYLVVGHAQSLWQLYAFMMCCAFGQGAFWPAIEADIADHSTHDELPQRLGRFNLAWGLGIVSGSLVGGFVGQAAGVASVFSLSAVSAVLALFLHTLRVFTPETGVPPPERERGRLALAPMLWRAALLLNFAGVGLAATIRVHMPTVTGGGRSALGGTYLGLFFFAQFVTFIVMARWHGWRYRFTPLATAFGLALCGALLCGLLGGVVTFGAGCFIAGLGCGVITALSLYYSVAAATSRGHRGGIHETVLAIGAAVVPYLGGRLATLPAASKLSWSHGVPHVAAALVLLSVFALAAQMRLRAVVPVTSEQ